MEGFSIKMHQPREQVARLLMDELDQELRNYYPDERIHGLSAEELREFSGTFIVIWIADEPIGCGALRPLTSGMAELKRMYVRRSSRGKGVGRLLLSELERHAIALGVRVLRLETGEQQVEAIKLYEAAGYCRIPAYGEYVANPLSVCYEKTLETTDAFQAT